VMKAPTLQDHLEFLLSPIYDSTRLDHPQHLADLRKSGLTDETIKLQKITDVPPQMIGQLLGFCPAPVRSALLFPYPDPRGGFMPHIRVKVFPTISEGANGHTIKYLQPRGSAIRVFFPLATLPAVLDGDAPLFVVKGEKKALAVAQQGLPVVGIAGVEGWHARGSRSPLPDFQPIRLMGRLVEIVPDSDYRTNRAVTQAVSGLATALAVRGAQSRVVLLPDGVPA
jgi:Domain of unknown function (DUF3854)